MFVFEEFKVSIIIFVLLLKMILFIFFLLGSMILRNFFFIIVLDFLDFIIIYRLLIFGSYKIGLS